MRAVVLASVLFGCTACHNAQVCRDKVDCPDGENVHHIRIPPQKVIVERGGAECAAPAKEGEAAAQGAPAPEKPGKVAAQGEPTPKAAASPAPVAAASTPAPMATYAAAGAPMQMQAQAFAAPTGLIPVPTIPGRLALQFGFKVIRIPLCIPTLSLTETPPETSVAYIQAQPQFAAVQSAGFVAQPQMAVQGAGFAAPMGVQTAGFVAPQQVVAAPQAAVAPAAADDGSAELIRMLLELKKKRAAASAAAGGGANDQEIKRLEEWTTKLENMVDALQKKLEEKNRKAPEPKPKTQSDAGGVQWQPAIEPSKKSVSWERTPYTSGQPQQTAAAN